MRRWLLGACVIGCTALAAVPAGAQSNSTLSGAAIGAGSGAIIAGPIGAVAGGVVGAIVGGPTFHRSGRYCWHDGAGVRHCRWR